MMLCCLLTCFCCIFYSFQLKLFDGEMEEQRKCTLESVRRKDETKDEKKMRKRTVKEARKVGDRQVSSAVVACTDVQNQV